MTKKLRWLRPLILTIIITALLAAFTRSSLFLKFVYPYHYQSIITANAVEYGVDPLLVAAIMRTESGFEEKAVSHKGALGLMQIMPDTAQWIAQQLNIGQLTTKQILDPEMNIKLGTWYLANLIHEFDGRIDVAIAAYNGGRGRVNQWLTHNIWSGKYADRADIPFEETRHFLFKVRAAYQKYQDIYR